MPTKPEKLEKILTITENSNADIEIWITGDDDEFANLTDFTQGRCVIRESMDSVSTLVRSTDAATMSIDTTTPGQHHVVLDGITLLEWADIPSGRYLADVVLGDITDSMTFTETFWVDIVQSVTGDLQ